MSNLINQGASTSASSNQNDKPNDNPNDKPNHKRGRPYVHKPICSNKDNLDKLGKLDKQIKKERDQKFINGVKLGFAYAVKNMRNNIPNDEEALNKLLSYIEASLTK